MQKANSARRYPYGTRLLVSSRESVRNARLLGHGPVLHLVRVDLRASGSLQRLVYVTDSGQAAL